MSAAVRKEFRLLLPNFSVGVLAALSVWLLPSDSRVPGFWGGLRMAAPFLFCPAMVVMRDTDAKTRRD